MATQIWKTGLAMLLIAFIAFGSTGVARAEELDTVELIPAVLVSPTDPAETPDPICSVCAIVIKPKAQTDTSTATMTLRYDGDFVGDFELIVWLDTDERASLSIPSVTVVGGGAVELELAPGEGWDWSDVRFVWTRLHHA